MTDRFKIDLTKRITDFLREIGFEVIFAPLEGETFLPGILIENGRVMVDEAKLKYPGDLLHEAGHLAIAPGSLRSGLNGEVILPDVNVDAVESQAMAWSYAAVIHLGLDPKVVFHEGGYKGSSEGLLSNFRLGAYIGVNGLQEAGMTATANVTSELGVLPYPHMLKWLRDDG
jgi:hypothetical protein